MVSSSSASGRHSDGLVGALAWNRPFRDVVSLEVGARAGVFTHHPVRADGSLTVLDFGCVKEFGSELVSALAALSRAVRADDPRAIRHSLVDLGAAEPDEKGYAVTRELLRGFFGPVLAQGPHRVESGLSLDTRAIMKDKLAVARMRLPARLLFLFRFGLHSELSRLKAVADWAALEERLCGGTQTALDSTMRASEQQRS